MSRDDDKKPAMTRGEYKGGFTPEAVAWMAHRTAEFQKATSGRGKPMVYGTGIPPKPKKPKKGSGDG